MTSVPVRSSRLLFCSFLLSALGFALSARFMAEAHGLEGSSDPEPSTLVAAARNVDRLVKIDLSRNNLSPNKLTSDSTFVRRLYLDVVGRIPDIKETRTFLQSKNPNKRKELIDRLFESPGYVSHNFNYWADIFRIKSRLQQQVSGEPFIHWMKQSLAENKPYDRMVHEMITAEGSANERGNGATGYLLRDRGMPLDSMSNTVRTFLGTRIECAQCHNHPSADTTQRQFFEMAAFFGGLQYNNASFNSGDGRKLLRSLRNSGEKLSEQAKRQLRRQLRFILQPGVSNLGTGVERLPNDYAYDDAAPNDFILAKTMFGKPAAVEPKMPRVPRRFAERMKKRPKMRNSQGFVKDIGSRRAFADWMIDRENPTFTAVIANRMWKKYFGLALVPSVDDMGEGAESVNPALSSFLNELMQELNYDLKAFQKVLVMTSAYQRESEVSPKSNTKRFRFPGPLSRRMSAEQFWDSMLTLVVPNIDTTIGDPLSARAKDIYDRYEDLKGKSGAQILASLGGEGGGMMSNQQMRRQRQKEMREKIRPLRRRLIRARRRGDQEEEKKVLAELKEMGLDPNRMNAQRKYGRDLLRASELPSPTPPGHFLRDFGQSDRDQADASSQNATVPQVLNLVNGFVEENLLAKKQGMMLTALKRAEKPDQKIRTVYLFVLNRMPHAKEIGFWRDEVKSHGEAAVDDLIWTLVNCHEFRQVN